MRRLDDALRAALARAEALSSAPRLDSSTFLGLRDLIAGASGIAFDDRSRFIVERRLRPRLRALHFDDFETYVRFLLHGPEAAAELERMLEAVVVRETYFFREAQQLAAFRNDLLPALAVENAATRTIRIWSAGCATGEEPYSVAILMQESGLFDGWSIRITGTDLVGSAVEAARRGVFRESAFRSTPEEVRARFFRRESASVWRIDDRIREAVDFEVANILDPTATGRMPEVDVVFCRNVLIYLGEPARRSAAAVFYERLRPGGRLLLGHAETLLTLGTPFTLEHVGRDLVYVK